MAAQRQELMGPVNATVREHVVFRLSPYPTIKTYWTGDGWGERDEAFRFTRTIEAHDEARRLQAQPEADGYSMIAWTYRVPMSDRQPTEDQLKAVARRMFVNGQGGGTYPSWQLKHARDAWDAVVGVMQS